MAKIKPAARKGDTKSSAVSADWTKGAPCLIILIIGFLLVGFLFYAVVNSSVK